MQEMATSLYTSRGRSGSRKRLDRISNLPDEVIHQILHFLPIRNVVHTCILSKRWRYIWTSMSDLVFRGHEMGTNNVEFIDKVLFHHNGNITKFEVHECSGCDNSDIGRWILFLSGQKLQHLFLTFNESDPPYAMPASFLCDQRLQYLELHNCRLDLQSEFPKFSYLTQLNLMRVTLRANTLEGLLVSAPVLRQLKIICCRRIDHFNIHAPQLKSIDITGVCTSFDFQKAPNIETVRFNAWHPKGNSKSGFSLDTMVRALGSSVHTFIIYRPLLELSCMDTAPQKLSKRCGLLTVIQIFADFEVSLQIMAVFCLIRSSPSLRALRLWAYYEGKEQGQYFWKATLRQECNVFSQLRLVEFGGFEGRKNEMGLVQFILLNAPVLELMGINWVKGLPMGDKLRALEDLMAFRRASSTAEVIFNEW